MNVYLSGPMSNLPNFNFEAFDLASANLRYLGHTVFSPAEHDREQIIRIYGSDARPEDFPGYAEGDIAGYFEAVSSGGEFTLDNMLKADLDFIVNECTMFVCLPGWEKSTGGRYERAVAEALNIPIYLALEHEAFDGVEVGYVFVEDPEQKQLTSFLKQFGEPGLVGEVIGNG